MPEIPITKNLDPIIKWFTICGIATFPNSKNKSFQYKVLHVVDELISEHGAFYAKSVMLPEYLEALIESPGLTAIRKEAGKVTRAAMVAGFSLMMLYRMAVVDKVDTPSVGKLIYFVNKLGSMDKKGVFPTSERGWRNYWNDFKSVAHLWAARVYCGSINKSDSQADYDNIPEYVRKYISVAEHFRNFGVSFRADTFSDYAVDEKTTWHFPVDIEMQKFELLPLKTSNKDLFDDYLADYNLKDVILVKK